MESNELREKLVASINKKEERVHYFGLHGTFGLITNCISSQSPNLDRIIAKDTKGRWGVPCGRTFFISGEPGTCKTTFCMHIAAETQRRKGIAVYIDGEHRLDRIYCEAMGIDNDSLIYFQPDDLEEVLGLIEDNLNAMLKVREKLEIKITKAKKKVDKENLRKELAVFMECPLVILADSMSIATHAEVESGSGLGEHARLLSRHMRIVTPTVAKLNACVIYVCQKKEKINTGWGGYGPKDTFLGENSLKFHSSAGLRMTKVKTIKNSDNDAIGDIVVAQTIKNSCIPPLKKAETEVYYGQGFDYWASVTELLAKYYGATKGTQGKYSHKGLGIEWKKRTLGKMVEADPKLGRRIRKLIASKPE